MILVSGSSMYQIEFLTTSESQETNIIRYNAKDIQDAMDNSFKDKLNVSCSKVEQPHSLRASLFPFACPSVRP